MPASRQTGLTDLPQGMENPLNFAVSERDRGTMAMVREALDHRRGFLAYQPVVQSARPDTPAFFEGLIRIQDHTGRVIPAHDFIGAVESQELGRRIDCLALEIGLAKLAQHPGLRLSINMSARSIAYPRWMQILNRGLAVDVTVAERLILEITESSAMLVPEVVQVFMGDLQGRGISFAIDDFGSGYTALRYFRDFDFDILKIDGSFCRGISRNPDNQALTKAMVSLARHFDMFTVAEWVETAEDASYLSRIGVDCLQGYHFGAAKARLPFEQDRQRRAG